MVVTLCRDAFVTLDHEVAPHIVTYRRTGQRFETLDDVHASFDRVLRAIDAAQTRGAALLVDSREAPGRNDSEFEQVLMSYRKELFVRFKRRALLVRTIAGAMQANRIERTHSDPAPTFQDEAEARAYLAGP